MNPCLKVAIVVIILTTVIVVITVPTVLCSRKKNNRSPATDVSSSSPTHPSTVTTNHSTSDHNILMTNLTRSTTETSSTTTQPITSYESEESNTTRKSVFVSTLSGNSNNYQSTSSCSNLLLKYEALEFYASRSGSYQFIFISEQHITFVFYENSFNPAFKYTNLGTRAIRCPSIRRVLFVAAQFVAYSPRSTNPMLDPSMGLFDLGNSSHSVRRDLMK
ncbi:unnamed protein product, partial [Adineta ricciae]